MLRINQHKVGHEQLLFQVSNMELNTGCFAALIGSNGAGKSTLLNALAFGLFSKNEAFFQNDDLSKLDLTQRSKIITLVDNHFLGLPYLPTIEYLKLGRLTHTNLIGKLREHDLETVEKHIESMQLSTLLNRATSTLSDGERQRVSIAKALIQETPIILLDEPTAFLDYPSKKEIMQTLSKIAKEDNRIILIASHDLDFCVSFCNQFLVIDPQRKELVMLPQVTKEDLVDLAFP